MGNFIMNTIDLLKFHTYSGNESIMYEHLKRELKKLKFTFNQDKIGNIYAVRGKADKYPLLNAHMDIIYDIDDKIMNEVSPRKQTTKIKYSSKGACLNCANMDVCIEIAQEEGKSKETILEEMKDAYACKSYEYDEYNYVYDKQYDYFEKYDKKHFDYYEKEEYGYSFHYPTNEEKIKIDEILDEKYKIIYDKKTKLIKGNSLRVLGGDDKCGISIALQVAKEMCNQPMKILFTVQEEMGCVGISHFVKNNSEWFKNVKYDITIDRRGSDNLIFNSCCADNCSRKFASEIARIGILTGINVKMEHGTVADVMHIRKFCESVNLSAGYYNPHTVNEYINMGDMIKIKEWVKNIISIM